MKSRINTDNYEAFLLDYMEGRLEADVLNELRAFALAHPELGIELSEADLPYLEAENTAAVFKAELKKTSDSLQDEVLLNYLENLLSETDKRKFEEKLSTDASLRKDLEIYRRTQITPDAAMLPEEKVALKKNEDDLVLNNRFIACLEGELSLSDNAAFEKEREENKNLQQEYALYAATRLVADASIVFENKESLKKAGRVVPLFTYRRMASIAAAVLLLFGLISLIGYFISSPAHHNNSTIAHVQRNSPAAAQKPVSAKQSLPEKAALMADNSKTVKAAKKKVAYEAENNNIPVPGDSADTVIPTQQAVRRETMMVQNTVEKDKSSVPALASENKQAEKEVTQNLSVQPKEDVKTETLARVETAANSEDFKVLTSLAVEEDEDAANGAAKPGIWERLVKVTRKANALGIKSVDGEESGNAFSLSFNSLRVEKK